MISGTRIHVAVEQNGFPISIRTSPANVHDSTKSADVMENISEFMDDGTIKQITSVYADKGGYDSTAIRDYLKNRNPIARIPFRKNSKSSENKSHKKYNLVLCVAERLFFGWLKNGFHRTRIRYERRCENYLAFVSIASFLMYCRVLR